ncbi:AraC family transcriptional regulator [Pseudomonas aeruginosa]|nr:AraC family transcriptional regulator [Pseudomonas aeruginosa]
MPTPPWSPRRSAISAHLLIQFGIDRGLGLEQCLAGSGLDIRLLGDPSGEIDAAQELSVVRNLVRHLGDACTPGLAAGLRYHLNAYGIWGFALLSSPTFLSAAQLGLRYLDLTFAFHGIRLEVHDDEAHLVLDDAGIPEDLRIFLLERDAGGVLRIQRDLTVRTLRRRLDDEGSSYRLLLDEVRQALAEELLATGAIRLEEIAERLGYGEVSNFIHAFRRWKGMTPRQYRQRRRLDAMS